MTDVAATYEDFIASRRSGRRNAIHDIPETPGAAGPSDLSQGVAQLNIKKTGDDDVATQSQDSPDKEKEGKAEGR